MSRCLDLIGKVAGRASGLYKTEWWGAGVVICLEQGIWPSWCHCHSMSLASVKSRLVLSFWYRLTQVVPEKGPLVGCMCGGTVKSVCLTWVPQYGDIAAKSWKMSGRLAVPGQWSVLYSECDPVWGVFQSFTCCNITALFIYLLQVCCSLQPMAQCNLFALEVPLKTKL